MDWVSGASGTGGGGSGGGGVGVGIGLGSENGPILYSEPNRTSAVEDIITIVIYVFIVTVFLSFFVILPGIRTEKFPTFLCITTSLLVTSIILIALFGTTWHVGDAPISAAYKAFSRDRIQGDLSVNIGLQSVNITLRAHKYYILHSSHGPMIMENSPRIKRLNVDINYNERFYWIAPNQMRQEHQKALERGLPYPILTVVEYLSQDEAGFSWSRQYRLAGYYAYISLWLSLCVCVLMFILHCAAPKYGIYTMQCLGCLLLFTNFTYATLVPRGEQKLVIPFEGQSLSLQFGWNFWIVLIGGCLSLIVGTLIVIIDSLFPNFIFTTILDVDFDSHNNYYKHRRRNNSSNKSSTVSNGCSSIDGRKSHLERPVKPPFFEDSTPKKAQLKAAGS